MAEKKAYVRIGAMWNNENGISGKLGDANVYLFPNKNKEPGSKQPDYHLAVSAPPKREVAVAAPVVAVDLTSNDAPEVATPYTTANIDVQDDQEIPF